MLKKRIIPCLDIKDGRTVKGVNFLHLKDAGDPVELAQKYVGQGADELVFLDISATQENRQARSLLIRRIAAEINIPFTVGGGIRSVEDAAALIEAGADKISLNTAAVKNPSLIEEIAQNFGNQCVVVAIDTFFDRQDWRVYISGGRIATDLLTKEWAPKAVELGAGEILLTSMNRDGTQAGFDLELLHFINKAISVPLIASGGAGTIRHFEELFLQTDVSAALAASVFHFGQIPIPVLKQQLTQQNIAIR